MTLSIKRPILLPEELFSWKHGKIIATYKIFLEKIKQLKLEIFKLIIKNLKTKIESLKRKPEKCKFERNDRIFNNFFNKLSKPKIFVRILEKKFCFSQLSNK